MYFQQIDPSSDWTCEKKHLIVKGGFLIISQMYFSFVKSGMEVQFITLFETDLLTDCTGIIQISLLSQNLKHLFNTTSI